MQHIDGKLHKHIYGMTGNDDEVWDINGTHLHIGQRPDKPVNYIFSLNFLGQGIRGAKKVHESVFEKEVMEVWQIDKYNHLVITIKDKKIVRVSLQIWKQADFDRIRPAMALSFSELKPEVKEKYCMSI